MSNEYAKGFRDARAACHVIALQWIDGDSQCDGTITRIADDIERLPGPSLAIPADAERMTGLCTDKASCVIASELRAENTRLVSCLSEDSTDAARYRWLKSRYIALEFYYGREEDEDGRLAGGRPAIVLSIPERSSWPAPWPQVPPERFDQSVDAAIALEPTK